MVKEIVTFLLEPLMNQRGQLGVQPPNIQIGNPGSFEETTEYSPFTTSAPPAEWKDLIARYQALISGGAGSLQSYQDLQRKTGLEQLKNTQAARGLGSRSGVGVAAAGQFLGQFEPRAAREQADYMGRLIGDYGTAINQGRESRQYAPTRTSRTAAPSAEGTGTGTKASSPFQYISSNPYGGGGGGGGSAPGGRGGSSSGGFFPSHPTGGTVEEFLQYGGPQGGTPSYGPTAYNPQSGKYEPSGMPQYQSLQGTPYAESSGGGSYRETYDPITRSWSMPGA
jgi:hypothetical protein